MDYPIGAIVLWGDALIDVPAGWQIADGTNGTVNLVDLWPLAVGPTYALGTTGGMLGINLSHSHGPGSLYAPGGNHYHGVDVTLGSASATGSGGIWEAPYNTYHSAATDHTHSQTTTTGDGGAHSHAVSGSTGSAGSGFYRTAYYSMAMYYIQRIS